MNIELERCFLCEKNIIYYGKLSKEDAKKLLELFELFKYFRIEYEEGIDWINRIGKKHICKQCSWYFHKDDD